MRDISVLLVVSPARRDVRPAAVVVALVLVAAVFA